MRAVILQMGVSLDGYVAGPDGDNGDWGLPPEDEAVTAWKLDSVRRVGTHIMGRVTYGEMAAYWPSSTGMFAAPMNNIPKVVFSRTLPSADWPDSRIARGDLAEEIDTLRHEPGGDIMVHGGAAFVQALSRQHLIDEYRLVIRAVALGSGLSLFKDLTTPLPLTLVSATTYPDGTAIHVYRPAAGQRPVHLQCPGHDRRQRQPLALARQIGCGSGKHVDDIRRLLRRFAPGAVAGSCNAKQRADRPKRLAQSYGPTPRTQTLQDQLFGPWPHGSY